MTEFTEILTHGRRLQGAVKDLTIEELELVADKLQAIIQRRKDKALAEQQKEAEKRQKAEDIKQQMMAAGLDITDLQAISTEPQKKSTGKKRPVKYRLTDEDGNEHAWTGIGRMPLVYKAALESGRSLSDFSV